MPCAVNCNIFLCDDQDCDAGCRVIEGRDQVEVAPDMGIVYGNVQDANGEDFEIDLEVGTTYYIWTNVGTAPGHIEDTTMTLFDADGTTVLDQNDNGPAGSANSYIEFTPAATVQAATILVAPKTRFDRGTFQLLVSLTEPDLTAVAPTPPAPTPPGPPIVTTGPVIGFGEYTHGDYTCYYFSPVDEYGTWFEAKAACEGMGAYLTTIDYAAELDWVVHHLNNNGHDRVWIGLNDEVSRGLLRLG